MTDLFAAWSVPAVLTALLSGLALGITLHMFRPFVHPRVVVYILAVGMAYWYLPQVSRLWAMDGGPDPVRTLSVWLLAEVWFVIPAWVMLTRLEKGDGS